MKTQILQISKDLEKGNIDEKTAQNKLLNLFSVSTRTLLTHDVWKNELGATLISDEDELPRYELHTIEFSYEPMGDSYWIDFTDGTQTKPLKYKDEIELILRAISPYVC